LACLPTYVLTNLPCVSFVYQVMKMIEENRRKNEEKRAAQSARNAEIIKAFEARTGGGS